jgi:hypothetical protein
MVRDVDPKLCDVGSRYEYDLGSNLVEGERELKILQEDE